MFIGVDGGGTRTTIALADETGAELARRTGAAGIVDPRWPMAAAESVVGLVRAVLAEVGASTPAEVLCAGLAGTGDPEEREVVRNALERAAVARRVIVCSDGEIALEGALMGEPGLLLVAGTGSVAWGRSEDGRVERCGGWGMIAGDEGSAYAVGQGALTAALRAYDGRGAETTLLGMLLDVLRLPRPEALPTWAGRAPKREIAALAQHVVRVAAEGDRVAADLVRVAAAGLVEHATALTRRLGPWRGPTPVVLHGGLAEQAIYAAAVEARLRELGEAVKLRAPVADAVTGALRMAGAGEALPRRNSRSIAAP